MNELILRIFQVDIFANLAPVIKNRRDTLSVQYSIIDNLSVLLTGFTRQFQEEFPFAGGEVRSLTRPRKRRKWLLVARRIATLTLALRSRGCRVFSQDPVLWFCPVLLWRRLHQSYRPTLFSPSENGTSISDRTWIIDSPNVLSI